MRFFGKASLILAAFFAVPEASFGAEPITADVTPWTFESRLNGALRDVDPVMAQRGVYLGACKNEGRYSCEVHFSGHVDGSFDGPSQFAPIERAFFTCRTDCNPDAFVAVIKAAASMFDRANTDLVPLVGDVAIMLREPAGTFYRTGVAARYVITVSGSSTVSVLIRSINATMKSSHISPSSVEVYSYGAKRWLRFEDLALVFDERDADALFGQPFSLYCAPSWGGLIAGLDGSFYAANERSRSTLVLVYGQGGSKIRLRDGFDLDSPLADLLMTSEVETINTQCKS